MNSCAKCLCLCLCLAAWLHAAGAAPLGGVFTLETVEGDVSLADFRGKVVPIYFGYMSCPDVCPFTLSALGAALKMLDESELQNVQGLFVSIDPDRDDLDRLSAFARYFHPRILGATGSPESIEEIASRYRIVFSRIEADATGFYTVDHTSRLALIGPDGSLQRFLPDGTPPVAIADAIRQLLP